MTAAVQDDVTGPSLTNVQFHRGAEFALFHANIAQACAREKVFVEAQRLGGGRRTGKRGRRCWYRHGGELRHYQESPPTALRARFILPEASAKTRRPMTRSRM